METQDDGIIEVTDATGEAIDQHGSQEVLKDQGQVGEVTAEEAVAEADQPANSRQDPKDDSTEISGYWDDAVHVADQSGKLPDDLMKEAGCCFDGFECKGNSVKWRWSFEFMLKYIELYYSIY